VINAFITSKIQKIGTNYNFWMSKSTLWSLFYWNFIKK